MMMLHDDDNLIPFLDNRKKSKPPPDVIQISSKSRLSGWSKPKAKAKSQHDLDSSDRDKGKQFKSYLKHRLGGIPRPYSDPCLNQQDIENNYQAQRKRSGASSAPLSSASSSSSESDSSDDDEPSDQSEDVLSMRMDPNKLEMVLQEKLKPAKKLECRSEEILLVTKETKSEKGTENEREGLETKELAVAKETEMEGKGLVARETTVAKDTEGEEGVMAAPTSTVAKDTEAREDLIGQHDNVDHESTNEVEGLGTPGAVCNDTPNEKEISCSRTENQLEEEPTGVNGEISKDAQTQNNQKETSEKKVDNTTEENNIDLENISEIKESYYESKRKLKNENILGFTVKEDMMSTNVQEESSVSPSPTVKLGLGGSFRSMAVSFKSKSSGTSGEDNTESVPAESNGEEEPSQQGFNRFRFSGRSVGARPTNSTSTSSNKPNIFASAQARGRTLLPDLRNKLSSISFPRARSPRLTHKQQHSAVDPDAVHQHKRHKHKHKCLTKIIEL